MQARNSTAALLSQRHWRSIAVLHLAHKFSARHRPTFRCTTAPNPNDIQIKMEKANVFPKSSISSGDGATATIQAATSSREANAPAGADMSPMSIAALQAEALAERNELMSALFGDANGSGPGAEQLHAAMLDAAVINARDRGRKRKAYEVASSTTSSVDAAVAKRRSTRLKSTSSTSSAAQAVVSAASAVAKGDIRAHPAAFGAKYPSWHAALEDGNSGSHGTTSHPPTAAASPWDPAGQQPTAAASAPPPKPRPAPGTVKLLKVINCSDGKHKLEAHFLLQGDQEQAAQQHLHVTRFGARGYTDFTMCHDEDRRQKYLRRHANSGREDHDNPLSAGACARWMLWDKPTLEEAIQCFRTRFDV